MGEEIGQMAVVLIVLFLFFKWNMRVSLKKISPIMWMTSKEVPCVEWDAVLDFRLSPWSDANIMRMASKVVACVAGGALFDLSGSPWTIPRIMRWEWKVAASCERDVTRDPRVSHWRSAITMRTTRMIAAYVAWDVLHDLSVSPWSYPAHNVNEVSDSSSPGLEILRKISVSLLGQSLLSWEWHIRQ